ncbi:MAG: hypothetical protein ACE5G8_11850, partial [Anaerolineae bacterium]
VGKYRKEMPGTKQNGFISSFAFADELGHRPEIIFGKGRGRRREPVGKTEDGGGEDEQGEGVEGDA